MSSITKFIQEGQHSVVQQISNEPTLMDKISTAYKNNIPTIKTVLASAAGAALAIVVGANSAHAGGSKEGAIWGAGTGVLTGAVAKDKEAAVVGGLAGAAAGGLIGKGDGAKVAGSVTGLLTSLIVHGGNVQEERAKQQQLMREREVAQAEREYQRNRKSGDLPHSNAYYNHQAEQNRFVADPEKLAKLLRKDSGNELPPKIQAKIEQGMQTYLNKYNDSVSDWENYFKNVYTDPNPQLRADLNTIEKDAGIGIAGSLEEAQGQKNLVKQNQKMLSVSGQIHREKVQVSYVQANASSDEVKQLQSLNMKNIVVAFEQHNFDPSTISYQMREQVAAALNKDPMKVAAENVVAGIKQATPKITTNWNDEGTTYSSGFGYGR